jgi:hypothetical protein
MLRTFTTGLIGYFLNRLEADGSGLSQPANPISGTDGPACLAAGPIPAGKAVCPLDGVSPV